MERRLERLLESAALGELDQAGRDELESLRPDAAARERLAYAQALGRALRALPTPQASPALSERTMARLAALPVAGRARVASEPASLPGLAFAATALLHLAAWYGIRHVGIAAPALLGHAGWLNDFSLFCFLAAAFFSVAALGTQYPGRLPRLAIFIGLGAYGAALTGNLAPAFGFSTDLSWRLTLLSLYVSGVTVALYLAALAHKAYAGAGAALPAARVARLETSALGLSEGRACAALFLLCALGHFCVAALLWPASVGAFSWLAAQPALALGTGCLFLSSGLLLLRNARHAPTFALCTLGAYLLGSLVNATALNLLVPDSRLLTALFRYQFSALAIGVLLSLPLGQFLKSPYREA